MQSAINAHQGAIAFVDNYTAWVTGSLAATNTAKIQQVVIYRAEEWERSSGATFQPERTAFIHFTRNFRKLSNEPVVVKGRPV